MVKNNDFLDIITNRQAVRKYDPNVKISKEEMAKILEDATKAPSAVNVQPWRFLIVESEEAKAIFKDHTYNSLQLETAAAHIVIFGDTEGLDKGLKVIDEAKKRGYFTEEFAEIRKERLSNYYNSLDKDLIREVVQVDGALVAMQLMLTARAYGYDTCAIAGFNKETIGAAFGYDKERYVPVLVLSIGKAAETPPKSVRLPVEEITEWR